MKKSKLLNVYKLAALVFIIALLVLPKAIISTPEIEAKLLITTLGFDRENEKIIVSGTAVMPSEAHDGSTMRLSVYAEGESLSEALSQLSVKMGKKLELGLCGLVVVGNTLAEESVLPYLEYLLSSGKIIPGAYLVYSPDRSAKEAIEMTNLLSEATSNGLSKLIEHNAQLTNMSAVTLHKFLSDSYGASKGCFMPCLRLEQKQGLPTSSGGGGSGGGSSGSNGASGGSSGNESTEAEINSLKKIMLFNNGVCAGEMDDEQTRGFTWTDKSSTRGLVTLKNFTVKDKSVGEIYCQLLDKSYEMKTEYKKGLPRVKLKVKALLAFEDRYKISNLYRYDNVSENELNKQLRSQFASSIKNEIAKAVDVMRNYGCDAIGIEQSLYRHNYKHYKNDASKGSHIQTIPIEIEVKVSFK